MQYVADLLADKSLCDIPIQRGVLLRGAVHVFVQPAHAIHVQAYADIVTQTFAGGKFMFRRYK